MKNLPKNDEEYFALLDSIVKGAEFLDNPLITEDQKARGMRKYDGYCEAVLAYRHAGEG
jgi:hypothetical protein